MNQPASILLGLLRQDDSIRLEQLSAQEWQQVIDLAFSQGVDAISVDSYNRWQSVHPDLCPLLETDESLEDLKFEWLGSVLQAETDYSDRKQVLKNLTDLFTSNGIKVLLLKGLGVGVYYLIPSHRPCGDIDIYLFDDYEKGNEVVASKGIEINRENSKHSTFTYQGVLVENHRSFLDLDITKAEQYNNEVILSTIKDCRDSGNGYLLPSPLTNYLFLLRHMAKHFCESGSITLRHLLDWGFFLQEERKNIDIPKGNALIEKMGLTQAKDIFTHLAQYVTGRDLSFALSVQDSRTELSEIETRFLDDIIAPKVEELPNNFIKRSIAIAKRWHGHRWKYKYIPDDFQESFWNRISRLTVIKVRDLMNGNDLVRRKM